MSSTPPQPLTPGDADRTMGIQRDEGKKKSPDEKNKLPPLLHNDYRPAAPPPLVHQWPNSAASSPLRDSSPDGPPSSSSAVEKIQSTCCCPRENNDGVIQLPHLLNPPPCLPTMLPPAELLRQPTRLLPSFPQLHRELYGSTIKLPTPAPPPLATHSIASLDSPYLPSLKSHILLGEQPLPPFHLLSLDSAPSVLSGRTISDASLHAWALTPSSHNFPGGHFAHYSTTSLVTPPQAAALLSVHTAVLTADNTSIQVLLWRLPRATAPQYTHPIQIQIRHGASCYLLHSPLPWYSPGPSICFASCTSTTSSALCILLDATLILFEPLAAVPSRADTASTGAWRILFPDVDYAPTTTESEYIISTAAETEASYPPGTATASGTATPTTGRLRTLNLAALAATLLATRSPRAAVSFSPVGRPVTGFLPHAVRGETLLAYGAYDGVRTVVACSFSLSHPCTRVGVRAAKSVSGSRISEFWASDPGSLIGTVLRKGGVQVGAVTRHCCDGEVGKGETRVLCSWEEVGGSVSKVECPGLGIRIVGWDGEQSVREGWGLARIALEAFWGEEPGGDEVRETLEGFGMGLGGMGIAGLGGLGGGF